MGQYSVVNVAYPNIAFGHQTCDSCKMKTPTELDIKPVQHINLFFCWCLGWSHAVAWWAFETVFGDETMHTTRSRSWYAEFQSGRTTLVDLRHSPRQKSARPDPNIQAVKGVVDADRSLTVAAIFQQTGLSTTSVHQILRRYLELTLQCAKLVPNVLTPRHIVEHFVHCRDMLNKVNATPSFLKEIVTMDESWFYQYNLELK